jgi:hypothetical protein
VKDEKGAANERSQVGYSRGGWTRVDTREGFDLLKSPAGRFEIAVRAFQKDYRKVAEVENRDSAELVLGSLAFVRSGIRLQRKFEQMLPAEE